MLSPPCTDHDKHTMERCNRRNEGSALILAKKGKWETNDDGWRRGAKSTIRAEMPKTAFEMTYVRVVMRS